MSAFVVDDSTIDRIVTFLGRYDRRHLASPFLSLGYEPGDQTEAFAKALFDMNCEAVDQRYADRPVRTEFHPEPYRYQTNLNGTDVAVFKGALCLRYQCSVGDVPETPLFKALDAFVSALACEIVCRLPEYDLAKWG